MMAIASDQLTHKSPNLARSEAEPRRDHVLPQMPSNKFLNALWPIQFAHGLRHLWYVEYDQPPKAQ
jgi:hypothetical protein